MTANISNDIRKMQIKSFTPPPEHDRIRDDFGNFIASRLSLKDILAFEFLVSQTNDPAANIP